MNKFIATRAPFSQVLQFLGSLFLCTLGGALLGQQAFGQPASEEQWYQVEVIIFSHEGKSGEGDETWRSDIDLAYPLKWLELVSPAQLSALASAEGSPGEDSSFEGPDSLTPDNTAALDSGPGRETIDPSKMIGEQVMLLLPDDELALSDQARRLSRNQQHRVLFHGAWRQPMVEDREEPSILISGGELFDQHHELEGSINLYLRTYLHIETDLWLSRFATNFGQERQAWPKLPLPPNRPAETGDIVRIDDGGTGLWHQFNQSSNDQYEQILAQPYVAENIVVLRQERRMRSNELHYIDHPRLGLLVKLSPYDPEDGETQQPEQ